MDTIVSRNRFERTAGLISWGQWRGWYPEERSADMASALESGVGASDGSGAVKGEGAQPSWFNDFSENVFTEPGVVNYATVETTGGYDCK